MRDLPGSFRPRSRSLASTMQSPVPRATLRQLGAPPRSQTARGHARRAHARCLPRAGPHCSGAPAR
eukprot:9467709-Pyramimonas_sp.AAC.1